MQLVVKNADKEEIEDLVVVLKENHFIHQIQNTENETIIEMDKIPF